MFALYKFTKLRIADYRFELQDVIPQPKQRYEARLFAQYVRHARIIPMLATFDFVALGLELVDIPNLEWSLRELEKESHENFRRS